jgi:hypothetical protein
MSFSIRDLGKMKSLFRFSQQPEFESPTLLVAWDEDAGRLGPKVIEYINRKLDAKSFCEVEPTGFFSLEGVAIENNIAQFPQGKFYNCQRKDLVVFKSNEPRFAIWLSVTAK